MNNLKAKCLCGRVTIRCEKLKKEFTVCHCTMCTNWGGTWMASEVSGNTVIEGDEHITVYDSSAWAERGFCSNCGTHLYYKVKTESEFYIPVGLFSGVDDFVFTREIFHDQKPTYFCFNDATQKFNSDEIPLADPPSS